MDLKTRVAIVSGGARGIGLAIAEDLVAHGASVVIVDSGVSISGAPLEPRLAEQVASHMERAAAVCGDIADAEIAHAAVAAAQQRFGAVDIVVNNAAIIKPANEAQAAYKEKALAVPARYVARLVSFLASDAAAHISGQLFGARGRELFLFSQARPTQRVLQPPGGFDFAGLAQAAAALEPQFAKLVTDLEAFSGDPIL